jgi:hypothetical protein
MARVAHHFEKLYPDPHQNQKPEAAEDYNGAKDVKMEPCRFTMKP